MLIRSLEYLLINILNGAKRRGQQHQLQEGTGDISMPPDFTVLGHLIGTEQSNSGDQTMRQLSDAGVVTLSPEARLRHLYLLGATGTGKTNLLLRLIESDVKNQRAFCVIDLRGDLVDRILSRLSTAAPSDHWNQRLLLVDLRDSSYHVGFNPLAGDGDAYTRALLMLSVIKKQSDSWGVQLEDTLRYSFMALAETGWSLLEVRPLLTNTAFRRQIIETVQDSQVRAYLEEFGQLSVAERNSRSGAALNKISPLLSVPTLRLMFGQRKGFSFSELLDRQPGMIILVALGVDRLHDAARLTGGLVISSFQSAIMARVDQPEAKRVPTHLYVDEFECMASDKFEEIVAEGRRFRVGLTLSHQNLSQLPLNLRHVIRNNVHTQVFFQTGALDAGELAKEIGHGQGSADIRAALVSLGVGEAFLVRRGQDAVRMRTLRSDDPKPSNQQLQALRAASLGAFARPHAKVEEELRAREEMFQGLSSEKGGQSSGKPSATIYHIRHAKTSHFGSQEPVSDSDTEDENRKTSGTSENGSPITEASKATLPASDSSVSVPTPIKHVTLKPEHIKAGRKNPAAVQKHKAPKQASKAKKSQAGGDSSGRKDHDQKNQENTAQ